MHLGDRVCARRPTGVAAQPDHGDMTTANAESGQISPTNKPGRGRFQHTAFVVVMGAQPIGLLEVDAKLRWRGVRCVGGWGLRTPVVFCWLNLVCTFVLSPLRDPGSPLGQSPSLG